MEFWHLESGEGKRVVLSTIHLARKTKSSTSRSGRATASRGGFIKHQEGLA